MAEHLWPLVDEALANKHFDTIDDLNAVVGQRCCDLHQDSGLIAQHAGFHLVPKINQTELIIREPYDCSDARSPTMQKLALAGSSLPFAIQRRERYRRLV